MLPNDPHLTDRDLILAADGELAPRREAAVRAHLEPVGRAVCARPNCSPLLRSMFAGIAAIWGRSCLRPPVRARC